MAMQGIRFKECFMNKMHEDFPVRITRTLSIAAVVLAVLMAPLAQAQSYKVLHSFTGADGQWPYGGVVKDKSGNLYGTTFTGGDGGSGVVFKIDGRRNYSVLYSFTGGADGGTPDEGVRVVGSGNTAMLYGATFGGGISGVGVVFTLNSSGKETVLHNFSGGTTDGCQSYADVFLDKAGDIFGTTQECGAFGYGAVWKTDARGNETLLHSFTGGKDGGNPTLGEGVIGDAAGNLYGFAATGGAKNSGVLYKLHPSGKLTVLCSFDSPPDYPGHPFGNPFMDAAGNLYGTTHACGSGNCTWGTVWKWSSKGGLQVLHIFAGYPSDGAIPVTGVILDSSGNVYGVTEKGGSFGYGVVFKLDAKGNETILHNFSGGGTDGAYPEGGLILDAKGNLYGTTAEGGTDDFGTVWTLKP
jgi:uncharacterized repeat protein (TIGR03803 family)